MGKVTIETDSLVSLSETARMLKISRPTLYKRIEEAGIRPVTIGTGRYLIWADIEAIRVKGVKL